MKKYYIILFLLIIIPALSLSQTMQTSAYRDTNIPYIEMNTSKYGFIYPIPADVLGQTSYYPPVDGLYFKAGYGHRYLSHTTNKSDNHGGFDYWADIEYNGVQYNTNHPIFILCMCDGKISEVLNGPDSLMELTATGRSVQVTCDSVSQSMGTQIKINYRHLSSLGTLAAIAEITAPNSISISKGDTIGIMGESGFTSNVHLHLSAYATHPVYGNTYIHTARLFDPYLYENILAPLTHAKIELLADWPDSALFRIIWPFNQTINRFWFINSSFSNVFEKEAAYATGASVRDEFDCVPGFRVFAYQFNGKRTAKYRYDQEKTNMPAIYPASPQRDANLSVYGYPHFPITHDSVASVYDIMVYDLPPAHDKNSFVVKLSDVWGYTIEGRFASSSNPSELTNKTTTRLYPNPVSDQLTLVFGHDGSKKKIRLFDSFGKQISTQHTSNSREVLDTGSLTAGIYFIKIETGKHSEIFRFIKN